MRVDSTEALGHLLRRGRTQRGLTQQGLADLIGASRDWVNRVERGRAPRAELELILRALISVDFVISVEESPQPIDLDALLDQQVEDHS